VNSEREVAVVVIENPRLVGFCPVVTTMSFEIKSGVFVCHPKGSPVRDGLLVLLIFLVVVLAYHFWPSHTAAPDSYEAGSPDRGAGLAFTCDGRTRCAEMHSCEEAKFYLEHCPNTKMDGDQDGVPCESQWCQADAN
jgi:hypothetical protein